MLFWVRSGHKKQINNWGRPKQGFDKQAFTVLICTSKFMNSLLLHVIKPVHDISSG